MHYLGGDAFGNQTDDSVLVHYESELSCRPAEPDVAIVASTAVQNHGQNLRRSDESASGNWAERY